MSEPPGAGAPASPVQVLRDAVDTALSPLQAADPVPASPADNTPCAEAINEMINQALAAFATSVAPVGGQLATLAVQRPGGPLATAMAHLRDAFDHLAHGNISPACTAMAVARAQLYLMT